MPHKILNIKCILILITLLFVANLQSITAQNSKIHFENTNDTKVKLNFKLRNNLVVIPVLINESDTLNFILDTGLKTSLITKLPVKDSLMLKFANKYTVKGLGGEGDLDVYHSYGNKLKIKSIVAENYSFYIVTDDKFDLSSDLGMNIHGLIGSDIFENFIVKINYSNETIEFYNPQYFKYSKRELKTQNLPLEFYQTKPYITLNYENTLGEKSPVKLLIDSGSSDALWLFRTENDKIVLPEKTRYTFLGKGLSGRIYGYHGRTKSLQIGKYLLTDITSSFPDSNAIMNSKSLDIIGRNGSVGAEILRRFDVIIDYHNKKITFKKNLHFKEKFFFNMAGLEVGSMVGLIPVFRITYIRENSPAHKAGIQVGDRLLTINGTEAFKYSVLEINSLMHSKNRKKINLVLQRGETQYKASFKLKNDL